MLTQTATVDNISHTQATQGATPDTYFKQGAMTMTTAAVIDANGTFGTHATVWFSGTFDECKAYAKRTGRVQVLAGCSKECGTRIRQGELKLMVQAGLWQTR